MDKKQSDVRHLYLYAKGHYVQSDRIEDLKKICSSITGIPSEHIETYDILYWLTSEAYKYIKNYDNFYDFLSIFLPDSLFFNDKYDNINLIIQKCLSILMMTSIDDIDIELGDSDRNILPTKADETF